MDASAKSGRRGAPKGFTLVEMIVTLAVVALATSLVLPSLHSGLPNWRVGGAVRDLTTLLKFARNQSVVSLKPLHVVFDRSRNLYWLDHADAPATADPSHAGRRKVRLYALPENVRFGELTGGIVPANEERYRVLFFPRGSSSGGEVQVRGQKGQTYTITIDSATGSTRVNRSRG